MEPFDPQCVFCKVAAGEVDAHMVYSDERVVAFLDARPLFPGHVLVVPRAHYPTLGDLPDDLLAPLCAVVRRMSLAVQLATDAHGSFIAENNVVSQSVPHVHVHVVPRTKGDGLRGFFWPRHRYEDEAHASRLAEAVRRAYEAVESELGRPMAEG